MCCWSTSKAGASFAGLEDLQHCVGLMTDLDEAGALRAIESLRSELRRRERVLAAEGVRSVEETSALPRLLVVVDEFAAMLQEHPDLHRLFARHCGAAADRSACIWCSARSGQQTLCATPC